MEIAIIALLVIVIVIILFMFQNFSLALNNLNKNIKNSVEPKFIEVSQNASYLIEHAIEIWRLNKRLEKVISSISEDQNKALQNSYSKLKRLLDKNDIEVIDYTNEKYNDGMNLDILATEKDKNIKDTIIKETHEPAVLIKGKLVKKAKVILLEP
jgi:hypothetical protein